MSFELFTASKRCLSPRVSIRPSGVIFFNIAAVKTYKIHERAQLFFDKEKNHIGIKFIQLSEKQAGEIKIQKRRRDRVSECWIAARLFFQYYKLDLPKTSLKLIPETLGNDMMILDYSRKTHEMSNL